MSAASSGPRTSALTTLSSPPASPRPRSSSQVVEMSRISSGQAGHRACYLVCGPSRSPDRMRLLRLVTTFLVLAVATPATAERIKDLADVEGVRGNPLVGYGIVVGLAGTGDDASSAATRRPLAAMMK